MSPIPLPLLVASTLLRATAAEGPLKLSAQSYPGPGKIVVTATGDAVGSAPAGASLRALLRKPPAGEVLVEDAAPVTPFERTGVILDVRTLDAGKYAVEATLTSPNSKPIGGPLATEVEWPGQSAAFRDVKILNNFVWELVNVTKEAGNALARSFRFVLPCNRWILVRSAASGELLLSLDSPEEDQAILSHDGSGEAPRETMRYLSAGEHVLHVIARDDAQLRSLIVRAIPALHHGHYHSQPSLSNWGPYDWEFLSKHILPQCNVMSSNYQGEVPPELAEWKRQGRQWTTYTGRPGRDTEDDPDALREYYAQALGMSEALMDGIEVDEFYEAESPVYEIYSAALDKLYADPKFAGKRFSLYLAGDVGKTKDGRDFVNKCLERGGYICWEGYASEMRDVPGFWKAMRWIQSHHLGILRRGFPNTLPRTVWVFASFSSPWPLAAGYPHIDFHTHLDMQFQFVATHPDFFGLGGVEMWHSGYSSEELLRWIGRAYRHYCLEGATERLSQDPYVLPHLQNPNFTQGATGWTLTPAKPGSMEPRERKGYGKLQGAYYRGDDTFLWMKRNAARPNKFSQEIRELTPGRLYSMKLFTGDYQDLMQERSDKKLHSVSIELGNVELLEGRAKSFQVIIGTRKEDGKFSRQHPFWWNHHWRVFRAKGTTAQLTVSDWKTDNEPGGPVGQELMCNFIEVQPYLEE